MRKIIFVGLITLIVLFSGCIFQQAQPTEPINYENILSINSIKTSTLDEYINIEIDYSITEPYEYNNLDWKPVSAVREYVKGKVKTNCVPNQDSGGIENCQYTPESNEGSCNFGSCNKTFQLQHLDRDYYFCISGYDSKANKNFDFCKPLNIENAEPQNNNNQPNLPTIPECPFECCTSGNYLQKACQTGLDCINNQCTPTQQQSQNNNDYTTNPQGFWNKGYCDKIDPYDLSVRQAASDAIPKEHAGAYSMQQLIDIYTWIKKNVKYLNVPFDSSAPYLPKETLTTKSGDCKNQAVVIASMVKAIGGEAKVIINEDCNGKAHAYAEVFFGTADEQTMKTAIVLPYLEEMGITQEQLAKLPPDQYQKYINDQIAQLQIIYYQRTDGKWVIFDPAGAYYAGSVYPGCEKSNKYYEVSSCVPNPNR